MKASILVYILLAIPGMSQAQSYTDQQNEILAVINQLFDGMRAGDSTTVKNTFHHEIEMFTSYTDKNGEAIFKKDTPSDFIKAVGTPHEKVWDEKLWGTEVKIDGNLAQVWTSYAFYLGETFSHCGVDAFLLTKTKEGWKIFHLSDTRQRAGCEVPEGIKD